MVYELSAEQIADHLRWMLSNRNSEIEPDGGPFLDVAFNASNEGTVIALDVSTFNADTQERNEQRFTLTVLPGHLVDTPLHSMLDVQ